MAVLEMASRLKFLAMGCLLRAWHDITLPPSCLVQHGTVFRVYATTLARNCSTVAMHQQRCACALGEMVPSGYQCLVHTNVHTSQRASPLGLRSRLEMSNLEYVLLAGCLLFWNKCSCSLYLCRVRGATASACAKMAVKFLDLATQAQKNRLRRAAGTVCAARACRPGPRHGAQILIS